MQPLCGAISHCPANFPPKPKVVQYKKNKIGVECNGVAFISQKLFLKKKQNRGWMQWRGFHFTKIISRNLTGRNRLCFLCEIFYVSMWQKSYSQPSTYASTSLLLKKKQSRGWMQWRDFHFTKIIFEKKQNRGWMQCVIFISQKLFWGKLRGNGKLPRNAATLRGNFPLPRKFSPKT